LDLGGSIDFGFFYAFITGTDSVGELNPEGPLDTPLQYIDHETLNSGK